MFKDNTPSVQGRPMGLLALAMQKAQKTIAKVPQAKGTKAKKSPAQLRKP